MAFTNYGRSVPEIFTDVVSQLSALLRKEGQLARAEISDNISKAGTGLALVVVGAVLLIPALVVLLQAVVLALEDQGFSTTAAAALAGGVALALGLILLLVGMRRLKPEAMIPHRTIHQLQQDASVAQDQMRQRDDAQHRAA